LSGGEKVSGDHEGDLESVEPPAGTEYGAQEDRAPSSGEISASRRSAGRGAQDDEKGDLPPLEKLVGRIPAETREALDELFRAKFTSVRRLPGKAFKS